MQSVGLALATFSTLCVLGSVWSAKQESDEKDSACSPLANPLKHLLKYTYSPSEFKKQGEELLEKRFRYIDASVKEAFNQQIQKCYQAFIQVAQVEMQDKGEIINYKEIDLIVERALQDFCDCREGLGAEFFRLVGFPRWIITTAFSPPISVDIGKISDSETCLQHLTEQAPDQTKNIRQLIAKTEALCQTREAYKISQDCSSIVKKVVVTKTKKMLSHLDE
jgi:hypothetical protein